MNKLLIVDDEDAIRRLLRINLADRYEILDTGDSGQALAMAMQNKPSAILLDLRMPNYSGFELCRTLKSMTSTQRIPIVIISGEAGASTKSFCKELGAVAYFEKPVDFDALRAGLEKVLHAAQPERRKELRVRLHVALKLRGTDSNGKPFEESSATENVSKDGFFCGCTAPLAKESIVEVYLDAGGTKFRGKARVVRSEGSDTPYPRYGFQFVQKEGDWILH
ncbi:MAG TPA: response regulator [Candidatus Sulfotelmatobacter sp.]|nr:response regulator [Candidatus Sulfotelmatobacter sp.]